MSSDRFIPFDTDSNPTAAAGALGEDSLPGAPHAQGWMAFPASHELVPFVAPAWDVPGSKPESSPIDALPSDPGQEQMATLRQEMEQEAQQLKDAAYAAGYVAGEQQGFEAGQQQVCALIQSLGQAVQEVGRLRAHIFEQSEGEMLALALAIARKVLHDEGSFHRDSILSLMRAGIKKATQRQELQIKVHPADFLFATSCKTQLLSYLDGIDTVLFQEDEAVPPGSCIVETPTEIIDLRWDEQLEEIAASLFETYQRAQRGDTV